MTLYQFNALKKPEQYETVWKEGVFLADRVNDNYKYLLYQINSFYVEVQYSTIEKNRLSKIVSKHYFA